MVDPTTLPPTSVILMYWAGGAFLMAAKRLSEFREIVASHGRGLLERYRASFAGYSETSLTVSCFVYALCSSFFLAVFLIKYRVEYLLTVPVVIALFAKYLALSMEPGSSAQKPEKLFRESGLIALVALLAAIFVLRPSWIFLRSKLLQANDILAFNNDHIVQASDWDDIDLVVFDVDGTLYRQRSLRLRMARDMLLYTLIKRDLKVIAVVRQYRRIRERLADEQVVDFERVLIAKTAKATSNSPERVHAIVSEWIELRPLPYFAGCRYPGVPQLFAGLRRKGKSIGILSDYPVEAKLEALELTANTSSSPAMKVSDCSSLIRKVLSL